jgi:hypothetical protein
MLEPVMHAAAELQQHQGNGQSTDVKSGTYSVRNIKNVIFVIFYRIVRQCNYFSLHDKKDY